MKRNILFLLLIFSILLIAGCTASSKEKPKEPAPLPKPTPPAQQPQPEPQTIQPAPTPAPKTGKLLIAVTDNPIQIDKSNCNFEVKKLELELEGLELKQLNGSWLEIPFLELNETNQTNMTNVTIDLVESIGIDSLIAQEVLEEGEFGEVRFKVQRAVMTQIIKIPVNLTNLTAFGNLTANLTINETKELEKELEIAEKKKDKKFEELEELLKEKMEKKEKREKELKKLQEEGVEVQQELKLPSNDIKLKHELGVREGHNEVLEIDFNLRDSFRCAGDKIIFLPVIDLESIDNASVNVKSKEKIEDGGKKIKHELEIEDGRVTLKTRHRMRDFGEVDLTNRIDVKEKVEALKKRGLEQEKQIEIKVEKGNTKIEIEIEGKKQKFILETENLSQAIATIANRTGLNETLILKLADIEIEGKKQEEKEADVEIDNGKAKIKVKIKGVETKFDLENTDLDKTLEEITARTGLTRKEILEIAKIKVEKEKEIEKEEDKSGKGSDGNKEENKSGKKSEEKDHEDDKGSSSSGSSGSSSGSGSKHDD